MFFTLVGWVIAQSILLLRDWPGNSQDRLILFSFIVAFLGCTLFNTVDVTLFDFRVNTFGWLLLASICGMVYHIATARVTTVINAQSKAGNVFVLSTQHSALSTQHSALCYSSRQGD